MGKPRVKLEDFGEMLNFGVEKEREATDVVEVTSMLAQSQDGILEMDFAQIEPFLSHKFKLYEGQQLTDMVESILQFGILLPIILWHNEENVEVWLETIGYGMRLFGQELAKRWTELPKGILSVIAYKLGLQDGIKLKREVREI